MPLQATSGAASYDAFGGGAAVAPKYIEDFFQTWLRTGTGSSATVTTGLNASINKSLVWSKSRSAAINHKLTDTVRGATKALSSNTTSAEATDSQGLTAFSSTGYTIGTNTDYNNSGATYVDWQWLATPKFFDVVTYTGNGTAGRTVAHNLGSVPGVMIVKRVDASGQWPVYHRSTSATPQNDYLLLNQTASAYINQDLIWNNTAPTSTVFSVGSNSAVNANGGTYVAYLFAHNAGGFGLTGTDNVISCGSFAVNSGGNITAPVNLGYEPQWVMVKSSDTTSNWLIYDTMRGLPVGDSARTLYANTSGAEVGNAGGLTLSATGFSGFGLPTSSTCIYIAIRRGPMRVPTTGTSVFTASAYTPSVNTVRTTNFPVDMTFSKARTDAAEPFWWLDRLRGYPISTGSTSVKRLASDSSAAETTSSSLFPQLANVWNAQYTDGQYLNGSSSVFYLFGRAPSFFEEVCFQGSNVTNTAIPHNLGVVPELVISKTRGVIDDWNVWAGGILAARSALILNSANAVSNLYFNSGTFATASNIYEGVQTGLNTSTNVAYLFASCPGVSKVGSYTGTGATQVINCGFTGGARFVLIKATSTTGNWMVWDSARGIVAGNDPYLMLNNTDPQVTNTDWVDTAATGFELSNAGGNLANSNGVSYIFLAIA